MTLCLCVCGGGGAAAGRKHKNTLHIEYKLCVALFSTTDVLTIFSPNNILHTYPQYACTHIHANIFSIIVISFYPKLEYVNHL